MAGNETRIIICKTRRNQMKRFTVLLMLIILLMAFAMPVYAGVFGTIGNYVKAEAWSILIGGILGALGMLGASYKLWGVAAKELGEFAWAIFAAVQPSSPGGKSITQAEMEKIIKEGAEVYPAVAKAIASHKKVVTA